MFWPVTDENFETESYNTAVRYEGLIHDYGLLNALSHVPNTARGRFRTSSFVIDCADNAKSIDSAQFAGTLC
jgi:hypothetical protein